MSKLSASYRFNSPLLFSPSGKRSSFDAAYHRFLLLGIFPRSIPRGNAIRSRTPLSYIFIRSRKRDNAKGNIENGTDLWRIVRYARGKRRRSYLQRFHVFPAEVCLVYVARIGMWKQTYVDAIIDHLSVLRRAIFFE